MADVLPAPTAGAPAVQPRDWPLVRAASGGLFSFDGALVLTCSLLLPILLCLVHLGPINRWLYPISALALGVYLHLKKSPWHIGFCIWLFCACSLVRRITDVQAGWLFPADPPLMAPYLACLPFVLDLLRYATRRRPEMLAPFAVIVACVAYGALLAFLDGRIVSGFVDALKWAVGPLAAVHVLRRVDRLAQHRRIILTTLTAAGTAMAIYGIAQFIDPQAWDREWMQLALLEGGLNSIGRPEPFLVRVFSTSNSPASLSAILVVSLIVAAGRPMLVAIPSILAMMLALMLTQYRAGWFGLGVGGACLFLTSSGAIKLRLVVAGCALFMVAGSLAAVPEIQQTISDRFDTLSRLSTDESGAERLQEYAALFRVSGLVFGHGLGMAGNVRQLDSKQANVIDGGVIEPFLTIGVFGATAMLLSLVGAILLTFSQSSASQEVALYRAAAVAIFAQLPFATVLKGEYGFCAWVLLGLALASVIETRRSTRLPIRPGRVSAESGGAIPEQAADRASNARMLVSRRFRPPRSGWAGSDDW